MLAKTAILREGGQQAGRGEWFKQARGRTVVFQLFRIKLGVAGQRQQQIVGHRRGFRQPLLLHGQLAGKGHRDPHQQNVVMINGQGREGWTVNHLQRRGA